MDTTRRLRNKKSSDLPKGYTDHRLRSDSASPFEVITDIVSDAGSKASSAASSVASTIKNVITDGLTYIGNSFKIDKIVSYNKRHEKFRRKAEQYTYKDMPHLVAFDCAFTYCFQNKSKHKKISKKVKPIISNFANERCRRIMNKMLKKKHLALQQQRVEKPLRFLLICIDIYRSTCFNYKMFEIDIFSKFFKQVEIANNIFDINTLETFDQGEVNNKFKLVLQNMEQNPNVVDDLVGKSLYTGIFLSLFIYNVFCDRREDTVDFFDIDQTYLTSTNGKLLNSFHRARAHLFELLGDSDKERIGVLCSDEFEMMFSSIAISEKLLQLEEFLEKANNEQCTILEALPELNVSFLFFKVIIKKGIEKDGLTVVGCDEFLFKSFEQVEDIIDSITINLVSVDYTAPVLSGPTIDLV